MNRCLFIVLCALVFAAYAEAPRDGVLDSKTFDFAEDHGPPRVMAEIRVKMLAGDGGARLQLDVSATGARVEAEPGYTGVAGSNVLTATELDTLVARKQLVAELRDESGRLRSLPVEPLKRMRLPIRRMRANGSLEVDGLTKKELLAEVQVRSPVLEPGHYGLTLKARGVPRLAVKVEVTSNGAVIRTIESIAEPTILKER